MITELCKQVHNAKWQPRDYKKSGDNRNGGSNFGFTLCAVSSVSCGMNPCSGGPLSRLENDGIHSHYDKSWDGEAPYEEDNTIRFLPLVHLNGKQSCHNESEAPGGHNHSVVNPHGVGSVVYRASYRQIAFNTDGCKLQH